MVKICPSCGTRAVDDQSLFCNKCGYPFPKEEPRKTAAVSRTDPHAPGMPAYPAEERAPARAARQSPGKPAASAQGMPFRTFIAAKHIRLIYFIGAIAIVLLSLPGILAGFFPSGTGGAALSITNTTALMENPPASPVFWIGFLIFGSLLWRLFCELAAAVIRIYDAVNEGTDSEEAPADEEGWAESMVRCPRCGKVVPADQLRECGHCGVQGCSNCIRMMGLVRKTPTCKDCFENK